ncbi:MAG: hypothetical protein M1827_007551 [Pycnora praestabilis]|nr:MAG: hypothetical protein M1827_007551 [Pycnora praestabilis]
MNEYCSRNYECESDCCDYALAVPGYGWGMCGTNCFWLADNIRASQNIVTAGPANDTCRHAIEFGVPTPYKLKVGNAAIVKADDNMQNGSFRRRRDFVTKDLGFGTDRKNAATFNVSISQHGRLLTALGGENDWHGYATKKVESGNGVGRLQITSRIEDAAIFTFTQYVEPKWENDAGPTRVRALLELIEKVCKPDDKKCAEILFENLRPESLGQYASREQRTVAGKAKMLRVMWLGDGSR